MTLAAIRGSRTGSATTSSTTPGRRRFVVDVSDYYDKKRQALACYASQFTRATPYAETRLNSPSFSQLIESRDAQFGALAGVRFAEGIFVSEPVVREHLLK